MVFGLSKLQMIMMVSQSRMVSVLEHFNDRAFNVSYSQQEVPGLTFFYVPISVRIFLCFIETKYPAIYSRAFKIGMSAFVKVKTYSNTCCLIQSFNSPLFTTVIFTDSFFPKAFTICPVCHNCISRIVLSSLTTSGLPINTEA